MIASLGMYDFPWSAAANDRLWAGVRDRLRASGQAAPETLTRGETAYWPAWEDPDLVLSQTCGYPFRAKLHDRVTLLATPDYGLPGCPPGHYRSLFVARKHDPRQTLEDFRGAPMAYNEDMSQSGWAAPAYHLLSMGLTPCPRLRTGGHRASAQAVAEGRADIAALDALSWEMLLGHEPATEGLHVVAATAPTPVLPFITAPGKDAAPIFSALNQAIAELSLDDRATLRLRGLVQIPALAYLAVPTPPPPQAFGMKN